MVNGSTKNNDFGGPVSHSNEFLTNVVCYVFEFKATFCFYSMFTVDLALLLKQHWRVEFVDH